MARILHQLRNTYVEVRESIQMLRGVLLKSMLLAAAVLTTGAVAAQASTIVLYGDEDGFGVSAVTFKDPLVDSAGVGEAAGTDIQLLGFGSFIAPAFAPTDILLFAALAGITDITITMSMAEFGGNLSPFNGLNSILIDGLAVPDAFLNSFSSFANGANPNIQTVSFSLPATFFPLFADGSIDLTGTIISERGGFGSFQIDYLKFEITADTAVPEPATLLLLGSGLGAVAARRRLKKRR